MPCSSEHLEPTAREAESVRVLEFLREIQELAFDHDSPHYGPYGHPGTLDKDTANLCDWCRAHDVKQKSLELQLWWQKHRRADAIREAHDQAEQRTRQLRLSAASKLTPEERRAVGLD
jgi:hypothetical protein